MLVIGIRKMSHKLPENFHVTLLGKKITPDISVRDLGIQLDSLLSFNEHIDVTTSTCSASLCQINRIKHLFDSETLENVISSLVCSKLYYGSTVCSNTTQKNIKKLRKVQNFAARIITCTRKYEHITPVIRQLGWFPVADMLKYYLGILTFKCLNGLAPDYLSTIFKDRSSVHDKNTRNNEKLNIPAFSSADGQRSFEYRAVMAVSLWNSLPADITACDNLNVFKCKF